MPAAREHRTYVALLRGINVGGRTKLAMAALRGTVESAGCTDVATYIQSGNVVLASSLGEEELRSTLERAIADQLGVATTVMLRTAAELAAAVAGTPYPDAGDKTVHVAFLHEAPDRAALASLAEIDCVPEELTVSGREIYLYLPNGMGRATLPVEFGRRLPQPATMRNWRTVTRLQEMSAPQV